MTDLNEQMLQFLEANSTLDSLKYASDQNVDHQKVVGAIKSLQINEGVSDRFHI